MAATTGIYTTSPEAGVNFYDLSSTPRFQSLLKVGGSNGLVHIYGKVISALGSVAVCGIGTAGSITAGTTTTALYQMNIAGGAAASQYCWIQARTI